MAVCKVCEVCGSSFSVPPSREKSAKVCSQACRGKLNASGYESKRVRLECAQCGVNFSVPPSVAESGAKLCSKECRDAWAVGKPGHKHAERLSVTCGPDGYKRIRVPDHPRAGRGTIFEHRYIVERLLVEQAPNHPFLEDVDGVKCLRREIHVHHINEDKADNRSCNLVACTSSGHKDLHKGVVPMRGEMWPEVDGMREPAPRRVSCTCEKCGTEFSVKRSTWLLRGAKYCSNKCASSYTGDLPPKVTCTCLQCGNEFVAKRDKVINGFAKFCSNDCRLKARVGRHPADVMTRPET